VAVSSSRDIQPPLSEADRQARRAAAREAQRRRRRLQQAAVAGVVVAATVAVVALGGSSSSRKDSKHQPRQHAAARRRIVPGGPLAPASVGGLAALWAPANVVAPQRGTAAAYAAASRKPGLGGYLLIADRGNNRILLVSPGHRIVFRYPTGADLAANHHLFYNDDTFVEPGGARLIANEEDNHAIVELNLSDRRLRVVFGTPGQRGAGRHHLNTPDDAYVLPDGSLTVADAYNCRILFIKRRRIVKQYGHAAHCRHDPPRYFGAVNGDTPEPDGGVLVREIPGHWVDEIGPDGRLRFAVRAPARYPSDPQPLPGGRILLADYASPGRIVIIDRRGRIVWHYGPRSGRGRMDHPSLAMALPNGNIAVNDDFRDRVIVIDPRRRRVVWQYGHTDIPGTGANYLHIPDGMDFVPAAPNGGPDWAAVVHP
jgi:hypothetical protein